MNSIDLRLRRIYRVPGTTEEYQLVSKFHQYRPCFRLLNGKKRVYGDNFIDKRGSFYDWYRVVEQKDGTLKFAFLLNLEEVKK